MKRVKGVSVPFDSSPSSIAAGVFEGSRIQLRHRSLLQDYEDLYKETEAQKDKLEMMKKKKMALMAEVRFLRQRYRFLKNNQSQNPVLEPKSVQRPKLVNGSRTARKEQDHSGNNGAIRIDLSRKKKNYHEKEAALQMRNPGTIPDLNQKERIHSSTPIFDLNQISMEEEELQVIDAGTRTDEPKICLTRGGCDDQVGDLTLSACRSVGNESSRGGKRKISWQDQVALRV